MRTGEEVGDKAIDVIGFLELVDENGFHGWAYSAAQIEKPLHLTICIDGRKNITTECTLSRPDVVMGGHPKAEVGFSCAIPRVFFDGEPHQYSFHLDELEISLQDRDVNETGKRSFCFARYFDLKFYSYFYTNELSSDNSDAFRHWKNNNNNFANLDEYKRFSAALGDPLPVDFSPRLYAFLNSDVVDMSCAEFELTLHYMRIGKKSGLQYSIQHTDFVRDAYFGGEIPTVADLERFVSTGQANYTSLDDMLHKHQIYSKGILTKFNVSDYVAANMTLRLRTRIACIRHFLEIGIDKGYSISFDCRFDAAFYCEINTGLSHLPAKQLHLHWLNNGIDKDLAPNAGQFLRQLGLNDIRAFPTLFNPDIYRTRNPDLPDEVFSTKWRALQHFIEVGVKEGRLGCTLSSDTSDIYRSVADRLSIAQNLPAAKSIYEAVLLTDTTNALALRHYADCLLKLREPFSAAQIYKRTIDQGKAVIWTHLNLVNCYTTLGHWALACQTLLALCRSHPGDEGLRRAHTALLHQTFAAMTKEVSWLSGNKLYREARQEMEKIYKVLLESHEASGEFIINRVRSESVIILADIGLPQCKFYRVDQKLAQMKHAGIDCTVFDYTTEITKFNQAIPGATAAIFYRVPGTVDVLSAINSARVARLITFYEIDDLMFDDNEFPDSFESYGGQISHDLYATLITGTVALRAAMSCCDFAIASTTALANEMAPYVRTKHAFVHKNGLGEQHRYSYSHVPSSIKNNKITRIFYGSGTKAHNEDFEIEISSALCELFEKYGNSIELLIIGYLTIPDALKYYRSQITLIDPIWDIRLYWAVLSNVDINIAVLKSGRIADCKSEIKWLEAAMFGVPSIVTATETYHELIKNGVDGLLVGSRRDWFTYLDWLVAHPDQRAQIGQAARLKALTDYSEDALSKNLARILAEARSSNVQEKTRRQRILIVNVFFPPQAIGGATRVVSDNVLDFHNHYEDEFEVEVFTTIEGGTTPYEERVYYWNDCRVTGVTTPLDPDIDKKVWDVRMQDCFAKVINRFKPDVVHCHCIQRITLSFGDIMRQSGIPYLVTVHDGWWLSEYQFLVDEFGVERYYDIQDSVKQLQSGGTDQYDRYLRKRDFLEKAELILSVSNAFAEIYRERGYGGIRVIENGVSSLQAKPKSQVDTGIVRLAHIGGASFHKGYNVVRHALENGDFGRLRLLVIDHAMDLGVEKYSVWGQTPVTFRGKFKQAEVGELYRNIDVLLAPSVWPESYGLVAREAVAAGCWVVASDRGAIGADIIEGTNGFVIDVASEGAISAVLSEINQHTNRYSTSPEANVGRPARAQADELASLYRTLAPIRAQSLTIVLEN